MTIKSRIVVANLAVFGVLMIALAYFVYSSAALGEYEAIDLRLEAYAAKVITEFEDEWEEELVPEWDDIMYISAEGLTDVRMAMRTIDGELIFGDESLQPPSEQLLQSILKGRSSAKSESVAGHSIRRAVFPVTDDDKTEFTLTLTTLIDESTVRLNQLALILFGAVVVSLVVASVAVYSVTRYSFSPLSRMVATAGEISADKLGKRLELPSRDDEVTRLGRSLNDMMDRIESAFKSQRQFVSDASHELRTPLTVILGELEFIQRELSQDSLKESVQTSLDEVDRLTRLVEQLLTLARIDAGRLHLEPQLIRLDEIVVDCVRLLQSEAEKNNTVIQVNIEDAIEIDADPIKLKSVILNLLENAICYSEPTGDVQVELHSLQLESTKLVQISVSNTGPVIPLDERERVFDRFYRGAKTRGSSDGSGLGLSIAKELVELHGGRIELDENKHTGTIFRVTIPYA